MKLVIQRVTSGKVTVDDRTVGEIGKGFLVLVGFKKGDSEGEVQKLSAKLLNLRIFSERRGLSSEASAKGDKMNRSILEEHGEILLVPQFTLYAITKGTRPGFSEAEEPAQARELFDYFTAELKKSGLKVETGEFGAYMQVELENDGPVTIILES